MYTVPELLKKEAYSKMWHVFIKKTYKGAKQAVGYLGRDLFMCGDCGTGRMVYGLAGEKGRDP
ncbi:hypothetical protein ADIS_0422 [Lunatimonas lonarensis]|uniref:Uncharacterized protein n=1 Tax=Lunatimonas lonarensis TaxID=1232681 RepID=R7ZYD4_9BACT|nr:hypothetical protein [Lunatimonas lonarensis]EON79085.1 hypothetical protein ADIS_0422 [Lunatimonas lonarensis]